MYNSLHENTNSKSDFVLKNKSEPKIYILYQKVLIFHIIFLLQNNIFEFTTQKHKFKR